MTTHAPGYVFALVTAVAGSLSAQAMGRSATGQAVSRAVDSLAERAIREGVTPALGVALVMDGRIVSQRSHGWTDATNRAPADSQTYWYIASTTKSFTGFAVSLLAHQGRLDPDAPIARLLPGAVWGPGVDTLAITLSRFMSHTAYVTNSTFVDNAAFTGEVPESRWAELLRFTVPSGNMDLSYSNFGYNIAGMVIDRLRPEGWRRYLDSAVLRPAGMRETHARVTGLDARRIAKPHALSSAGFATQTFDKVDATMHSAGGHLATLADLARWTIVQMDSGRSDGRQVFPSAVVERSHRLIARHTRTVSQRFGPFARDGWGAGWDIGSYRDERMVSPSAASRPPGLTCPCFRRAASASWR